MNSKQKKMKKIKLTLIGLLLSIFSYGQTDTIIKMINGKNLSTLNKQSKVLDSTDYYNKGFYEDFTISIDSTQGLLLHLYDNCKYCKNTNTERTVEYTGRITNTTFVDIVSSTANVYYLNGEYISNVTIRKPKNE